MQEEYVKPLFIKALDRIGIIGEIPLVFEVPKNPDYGDLSTNIAMRLAKQMKTPPLELAKRIIENLDVDYTIVEALSVANPGFINIRFSKKFYFYALKRILETGEEYGRSTKGKGKRANVEYVSVNPTGLLHLGHGRNAAIGDTIANLYEWLGWDVTREYYFNNAGNQMNNLARSVFARYRQLLGESDYPFPEDGYHGDYIKDIADELIKNYANSLFEENKDNLQVCRKFAENWCFDKIRNTLARMGIHQDIYFNEDSLYADGKIAQVIEDLEAKSIVYEKDGALWLALSKLGLSDDRVIVKSTGEPTYRLPDIAYHREKYNRGYDLLVDVLGADHIATVPDVLAALKALGYDTGKLVVLFHQFVTLTEAGEQVKMSKRSGKVYTLDDLLDEVGADVVRFFLLMRGISTHLEFDLALAREQSEKNPVFYLQYAHARICSVFENAKEKAIELAENPNLSLLETTYEIDLIKYLIKFPEIILNAAEKFEIQIIPEYLRELAQAFHSFYHECRIISVEEQLQQARLWLCKATKTVLRNGLSILGITAPERM